MVLNRAPWTPARSKTVIIEGCGHIELDWPQIKAIGNIGPMAAKIYCERCDTWTNLWREATPAEIVGIEILPLPDDCPF